MKNFLFALFVLVLIVPAMGQKHAFVLSDLYEIKIVADPRYSPDGKKIAFVVTENNLEEGKSNQDIYLMNADGNDIRNITNNPAADNHPRWSPDGASLLFISTRENGSQAWLLSPEGGTPTRITDFAMGVGDAEWAPDGKHLIFSADVFADCGADNECNKYNDSTMTNGPIQAHMADRLLYRHWNFWKDGKITHVFVYSLESKTYADLTPGEYDSPSWEQGGVGFAFSPDGKEVCYVSDHSKMEAASTNKDLWLVSSKGGESKNITGDNLAYDGNPQYSPDGRYIAYTAQTIPGYEADRFRLMLYDRATGKKITLTEDFDYWVSNPTWSADSKTIYFTSTVESRIPLYSIEISSKKITKIIDLKCIDGFDLSSDNKSIVYARRSIGEPTEVWSSSGKGKDLKQLTSFNKEVVDQVDIRPEEEVWIPSPTGKKIHTFIIKPHNFDPSKKYPVIVNVHGGPQSPWYNSFRGDWQMYPGSGYIEVMPNPHGSHGYRQEFCAAISKDWNGKVIEDIMAVTDSIEKLPYVDKDRIGAMGWSYGGYVMMWLEGHTTRFKAIVSMMGTYDLRAMYSSTEELWFPEWELGGPPWASPEIYQQQSPSNYVQNFKTPCLVLTGEKDFRLPYTGSLEFFTDLQKMGVPSRLIVFPNDGHWPNSVKSMPLYYNAHLDWFHKYLGGDPAPYDMTKMVRNQEGEVMSLIYCWG